MIPLRQKDLRSGPFSACVYYPLNEKFRGKYLTMFSKSVSLLKKPLYATVNEMPEHNVPPADHQHHHPGYILGVDLDDLE